MFSDYFLQFKAWSFDKEDHKIRSKGLYWHVAITMLMAFLFSGSFLIALFVGFTHGVIDLGKTYLKGNRFFLLALDQCLHLIVIFTAAAWFNPNPLFELQGSTRFWILFFGFSVLTLPYAMVSKIMLYPFRERFSPNSHETWAKAEAVVGITERVLTLICVLEMQWMWLAIFLILKFMVILTALPRKGYVYFFLQTAFSLVPTILMALIFLALLQEDLASWNALL